MTKMVWNSPHSLVKTVYHKNGRFYRDADLPAFEDQTTKQYFKNGMFHREKDFDGNDQPAVIETDGRLEYWFNDQLHRVGQPAIIDPLYVEYWLNGKLTRENDINNHAQPARIHNDGTIYYYKDTKLHRDDEDGVAQPAICFPDGTVEFWKNDAQWFP